jgi:hypothetical protein
MVLGHRLLCVLAVVGFVAIGCTAGAPGWHGPDVHLVDGTWIATESRCSQGDPDRDLECRTIVERTLATLPPDLRGRVRATAVANLPTAFVTASGEPRTARLSMGLNRVTAVVLDLDGGERRVIGMTCYLPYSGGAIFGLIVRDADCWPWPLDDWLDGHAPPSSPPGTKVG